MTRAACRLLPKLLFFALYAPALQVTYRELLDVFWGKHDPTSLNKQGADVGTQYRAGIYTHSDEQAEQAAK